MRRREFIWLVGGAMAWPIAATAQQPKKVLGALPALTPSNAYFRGFITRLRELGWTEGRNLVVEIRWDPSGEHLREFAADLVRLNVDVIYAAGSPQVDAAYQATKAIPIVFSAHGDPVGTGHVATLANPGGNITGLSNLATELTAKGLDVLKEAIPTTTRVGILWDPSAAASNVAALKAVETAGINLGLQVEAAHVRSAEDFERVLLGMAQTGVRSFLGVASPLVFNNAKQLAELALKYHLAAVFSAKDNAAAGGLISYGPDFGDLTRRAADYVDKIFRGAKPGDLPVEQASKYLLVINMKTAKALGLTMSPSLLARADEVIE